MLHFTRAIAATGYDVRMRIVRLFWAGVEMESEGATLVIDQLSRKLSSRKWQPASHMNWRIALVGRVTVSLRRSTSIAGMGLLRNASRQAVAVRVSIVTTVASQA